MQLINRKALEIIKYRFTSMRGILLFIILFNCAAPVFANANQDCVVLLHGLARTADSLSALEHHLEKEGFNVVNIDYPSRKKKIEQLSIETISLALDECNKTSSNKIHFVTHSLGGILIRYYLEFNKVKNLGRVVMISPPNHGSEVVDQLKDMELFKLIYGPAGDQLSTGEDSIPNLLGPPYYETGIITGDRTLNPILSLMIPGKDDGKVSVESAKLEGMKDFLVVHKSHPFIMNDEEVCRQVTSFIKNGRFIKKSD